MDADPARAERVRAANRLYMKRWRDANPELSRQRVAAATDPDVAAARTRAWTKANPGRKRAQTAAREAQKLQATPAWANHAAIVEIYQEARDASEFLGIPHEVDHIIPLRGRTVCGLHVENNLRVVDADTNRRKSNKVEA